MHNFLLCSDCFTDTGLKHIAYKIGKKQDGKCEHCSSTTGAKLCQELVEILAHEFFVRGTIQKFAYGAAPLVQFNKHQTTSISVSFWLKNDIKLIEKSIGVGFFYYGPRLWMVGEVEPLKSLEVSISRKKIIDRILREYPEKILSEHDFFYRLRVAPSNPMNVLEYDSPPDHFLGRGRLDSESFPILYGSQDLEVCVHECRVTVDDELYLATLRPCRELKLLDLSEVLTEEVTEFESLDLAIHMLFMASRHSYEISRDIATMAKKHGFDGIIYPSYFSLVKTGAMPLPTIYGISVRQINEYKEEVKSHVIENIALFGRPIQNGDIKVDCINRLQLNRVAYDLNFGPIES